MSITDAALQALIIAEVGDYNGILAANVPLMWQKHQKWRTIQDLQYLYTKREAVQTVLAALRGTALRKTIGDLSLDKTPQIRLLENESGDLSAQILERLKVANASAPAQVTALATTQIEAPTAYQPTDPYSGAINGNDARYRGDVYKGRRGTPW